MKNYIIVAESGADLPKDIVEKYGIYVVAMHVNFDMETKDDGDFPITDIFDYYQKTKILPKSAAANAHDFGLIFDRVHEEHPDKHILYLAYSAVTTCTYQNALIAMEGRDYITPVDTKHCSAGQAFVVTKAAQYIEEHPDVSLEEIVSLIEKWRALTHMGFFPGDLEYLRAGGRVSNAAYLGAKILSLNPLIEINDGYLIATEKYRGKMGRVASKLLTNFVSKYHFDKSLLFLVYSPGLSDKIKEDLEAQAKELGFQEIRWVVTGCVVSIHSGPGAFGLVGIEG